jgi:hypothetical protein
MKTTQYNRCKQLSPLSGEHIDGMLFVKRLRQGLDRISTSRLVNYTGWYWKNHIRPHFFHEEKILLPHMPGSHPLAVRLQEEHAYIRDLVLSLDHEADRDSIIALCDVIESHILFEEQQVFAYLEAQLPEDELDVILLQLEQHPLEQQGWNDPFWE